MTRQAIGYVFPPHHMQVEAGRLRFFAKAIGETDPAYANETAARATGYSALPVPPTFLFCLEMERPDPFGWLAELGLDLGRILHGEQTFTYHALAFAGDTLHFEAKITDSYEKKGGTLRFLVKDAIVRNQNRVHIADLRTVLVHRSG
ncbi:MAG TPA: MaoC family dehydratase N-terminal domain-containing protein [Rhizomicrobium sp.]